MITWQQDQRRRDEMATLYESILCLIFQWIMRLENNGSLRSVSTINSVRC
jgi:hypothetical protein